MNCIIRWALVVIAKGLIAFTQRGHSGLSFVSTAVDIALRARRKSGDVSDCTFSDIGDPISPEQLQGSRLYRKFGRKNCLVNLVRRFYDKCKHSLRLSFKIKLFAASDHLTGGASFGCPKCI
jgi:hypothetical protein